MGIAPLMQYKQGTQTVGGYDIHEETYVITNCLVLGAIVIFDLAYYWAYGRAVFRRFDVKYPVSTEIKKEPRSYAFSLIVISMLSLGYTLFKYHSTPLLLVFRGVGDLVLDTTEQESQIASALYHACLRPLAVVCCINYLCVGKKLWVKVLLVMFSLVSCFPTALARLRVAAYYLPMLIILFPAIRYHNRFVKLFIFGFLIVFPLLNNFRTWGESEFQWFDIDYTMFCNMNYDSYQSFAFVVQNDIIKYGRQLLVVLFFWVPRAIWPDKPFFSGLTVAQEHDLWFQQISMNYFAEGYINFGIIGVVLFTLFLGFISARFDKGYWHYNKGNPRTLYAPFFLLFVGMYFFFMRGDLMYGFEYTICLLMDNYLIYRLSYKLLKRYVG